MNYTHISNWSAFFTESKNLIRLALPIFIGQICTSCLGLIDSLMAADVGTVDLAAIALATTFWLPVSVFCVGLTLGLAPIVAQLHGANQASKIPNVLYNALFPSFIISVLSCLFLMFAPEQLFVFVDEIELKEKAVNYLFYVSFSIPAIMGFNLLKNSAEGLSIASPSMVIGFLTLLLNIPINYIFIYGKCGMPAMGAVGCGVATSIVCYLSLFMMFIFCRLHKKLSLLRFFTPSSHIDKDVIKHVCYVGIPLSLAMIIETMSYAVLGYAITPFGSKTVAAHQIANIVCILAFMIPLSIATAITIRVGHSLGEGSIKRVKRALFSGIGLAMLTIYPTAAVIFCNKEAIIAIFSTDPQVAGIALTLFTLILIYQIQDPFFGATLGLIRGFKDTRYLLAVNIVVMMICAIPAGYFIGLTDVFGKKYGVFGMWCVLVACYYTMTVAFAIRGYIRFTRDLKNQVATNRQPDGVNAPTTIES